MEINITLFIQVVHFYIVYFFLDIFFFRPFVAHITQKTEGYANATRKLQEKEISLSDLQDNKNQDLKLFQQHIQEHYVPPNKQHLEKISFAPLDVSQKNIDEAKNNIQSFIIERVCHAR